MFEDTWITLNRKVGEALILSNQKRTDKPLTKPSRVVRNRRNAVTVIDLENRLMTNGRTWPRRDDWMIGVDKKIRYAPAIHTLRKINSMEWNFGRAACPKKDQPATQQTSTTTFHRKTVAGKPTNVSLLANKMIVGNPNCKWSSAPTPEKAKQPVVEAQSPKEAEDPDADAENEIQSIPDESRDDELIHAHSEVTESHFDENYHHNETSSRDSSKNS